MADALLKYYDELNEVRRYLIKKGQARFKGSAIENTISKVEQIIQDCETLVPSLKGLNPETTQKLSVTYTNIKTLYTEILNLCTPPVAENSHSSNSFSKCTESVAMDFDLKTACGLIPLMDDAESTTKRLIDTVDMYSSMLSEAGKIQLITFILKGRLSENAKLRMSRQYSDIESLLSDLRNTLLPKKSFTAIQSRLQTITQGWRTVDQYGTEIEKLLSELTITQAGNDSTNFDVLKPLNEKTAVKRFSDGLRDKRLSTIIAARNYDSLADAIQAAKDEECTASTSAGEGVMHFTRRGKGTVPHTSYYSSYRGVGRQPRGGYQSSARGQFRPFQNSGRGRFNNSTCGRFSRGRSTGENRVSRGRGRGAQRVFCAQTSSTEGNNTQPGTSHASNSDQMQFFRS
jgi:hypothetical protein